MKYSDLVQFEPIQSVKVLTEADNAKQAEEDVRTFVVSDRMLEQLGDVIAPHLQFGEPSDNRGLLIVANYGTGKTHLMSVISSIAERQDLAGLLQRPEASEALQNVAGKFRVIRAEIGATRMSLRDIVCGEIESGLKALGITFRFKPLEKVAQTKDQLVEMMVLFEKDHPDQGLLFVLDELLDYLRTRKDAELIQDLAFLREVGEICRTTRFRFIGGVQEALFDNPRFANVADAVKRVKDRFEQVRISREDVAYVVKERLLKKRTEQRDAIRVHLQPFTPLYEGMAENLDEFVALFPVHPAYIRTFEQITSVEKREILKTLSAEMTRRLDEEVPAEEPGLICYDSYRARLAEDPSVRQIPEVREVLEKSDVLRNRVQKALATPQYVSTAVRIIDGLAIHRLTTDDIYVPIGATRKELRDDLCLLPPNLPERDSLFLESTIDAVIEQIMHAVSGQFITENSENGQVYLDVRKDIDYDQKIEERANALDEERLDEAYFRALEEVLERRDKPYVAGYRIWEYELPWADHRVTRFGYLFMGAPNERSTAQPPRDFYVYFLQPYAPPDFTDDEKEDEVFFRLVSPDDEFTGALRQYAGATALARESTATHRTVYEEKARVARQKMTAWLRSHMGEAVTLTHRGETQPLRSWLSGSGASKATVKEQVDSIAAKRLSEHFEARYPGYPKFTAEITRGNMLDSARAALQQIATNRKTELSSKVLASLALVDVEGSLVESGEFAKTLLSQLKSTGGKALTRDTLLSERDPGVPTWGPWHLEPTWLVVVAAALTQLGRAEVGFSGHQIDALALDRLTKMSLDELEGLTHIAPPKELPVVQLRELAKLLDLAPGIVPDTGVDAAAVRQILQSTETLLARVVQARSDLQDGPSLWGAQILELLEERERELAGIQSVLENVRARDSVGKMNRLDVGREAIEDAAAGVSQTGWIETAIRAKSHLSEGVEFIREASEIFGPDHPLSDASRTLREELLELFRGSSAPEAAKVSEMRKQLEELRELFAEEAARAHARDRLDGPGDNLKRQILESGTYKDLRRLSAIALLPKGSFGTLENRLVSIQTCKTFDEAELIKSVICRECGYRPQPSAGPTARAAIEAIEAELGRLAGDWEKTLAENLRMPEIQEQIPLLKSDGAAVQSFHDSGKLPTPLDDAFVSALNQVFRRFEVRRISRNEVWAKLFPEQTPATPEEIRGRFTELINDLTKGASEDRLRIVPSDTELAP